MLSPIGGAILADKRSCWTKHLVSIAHLWNKSWFLFDNMWRMYSLNVDIIPAARGWCTRYDWFEYWLRPNCFQSELLNVSNSNLWIS